MYLPVAQFCLVLTFSASLALDDEYLSYASDDSRIVGGQNTTIDRFPYQVSVRISGQHVCSGTIVKLDVVITAARCIPWFGILNELSVVAGTSYSSQIGLERKLKDVHVHPDFEGWSSPRFDVALLILAKSIYYSEYIQPIILAKPDDLARVGTKAIVSGWEILAGGDPGSDQLQYIAVYIFSNEMCSEKYGKDVISPDMLCAGGGNGGKDFCQSDLGSPLVVGNVLVGIVSWGNECDLLQFPDVYARISYVRDWIDSQLNDLGY